MHVFVIADSQIAEMREEQTPDSRKHSFADTQVALVQPLCPISGVETWYFSGKLDLSTSVTQDSGVVLSSQVAK